MKSQFQIYKSLLLNKFSNPLNQSYLGDFFKLFKKDIIKFIDEIKYICYTTRVSI